MTKDKKNGKIQLLLVIAFVVGAFIISALLKTVHEPPGKGNGKERLLVVETMQTTTQSHRITFDTTGTVEARTEIGVVPEVSGRVIEVHPQFFDGGVFKKNERLFQIDPRDFRLAVQHLEAQVASAQTTLELEQAESNAAKAEWEQLHGSAPAPDLVLRIPQLKEARASLKSAQAQLEDARLDLERSRFSLPFSGRVLSSDVAAGQYVMSGQNYGQVFDLDSLEVQASLQDKQLEWLLANAQPNIRIQATYLGQQKTYEGMLNRSASSLDDNTRFATVRFGFKQTVIDLLPGVFTHIHVEGPELENVTLLPPTALQSDNIVWQVSQDNRLQLLKPNIIYADDTHLIVRDIPAGTHIVTSRIAGAADGMQVRILNEAADNAATPTPEAGE